jgi:Domain of unknown function (DUF4864)
MSPRVIHFLRPTCYALIAFGALVGVANLYWSVANPVADLGVAGLDPQDLIGVDLSRVAFPNPKLPPEEVVRLQLAGLSDAKADGVGILQCFCLASPGNRVVTGPLERFGQMVRNEPYDCMAHPRAVLIGRPQHGDDVARLLVTIIDQQHNVHAFAFVLSKQKEAPFKDCWMTEAVLSALPTKPASPIPEPQA